MFTEIILTLLYTSIFILIIFRWRFFKFEGLRFIELAVFFIIKILAGLTLTLIYTHYYPNREDADLFKFFDDSAYVFNALFINPMHYLQLVFGINADAPHLSTYIEGTHYWAVQTDAYQQFTSTENVNFFNAHRLITRFNAVVRIFSFGHYTVHTVFMCFLSLIGLTALYKTFYPYLKEKRKWLMVAVFLMPSVVLWSSGVLKEGFIFLALGLFILSFFKIMHGEKFKRQIFVFILSAFLLVAVKYYIFVALVPAMFAYFITHKLKLKKPLYSYCIIYGLLLFYIAISSFFPKYLPNPLKILTDKQSELIKEAYGGTYCIYNDGQKKEIVFFRPETSLLKKVIDPNRHLFLVQPGITAYKYAQGHLTGDSLIITPENLQGAYFYEILSRPTAGSLINIRKLEPNLLSFIMAAPQGLINVLFRPHFFEISSFMLFPAAFENLFIVFFIVFCLYYFKHRKENINLKFFLISSVITLYIIIGITTPVLGSIVRYKAVFLPFFIIFWLLLSGERRSNVFHK